MAARHHNQQVTYWPITGKSEFTGFTFGNPQLLQGRWEDKIELTRAPTGEEVVSKARVFLDVDVIEGDYLALGDYLETPNPTTLSAAYRIMMFQKTPDLRNVKMIRKAML